MNGLNRDNTREDVSAILEDIKKGRVRPVPMFRKALEEDRMLDQKDEPPVEQRPSAHVFGQRSWTVLARAWRAAFANPSAPAANDDATLVTEDSADQTSDTEQVMREIRAELDRFMIGTSAPAGPSCSLGRKQLPVPAPANRPMQLVQIAPSPPILVEEAWPQPRQWTASLPPILLGVAAVIGVAALGLLLRNEFTVDSVPVAAASAAPDLSSQPALDARAPEALDLAAPNGEMLSEQNPIDPRARKVALLEQAKLLMESPDLSEATTKHLDWIFAEIDRLDAQLRSQTASVAEPEATSDDPPKAAGRIVHLRAGAGLPPGERQRIEAALAEAGYEQVVVHQLPFPISRSRVGYFREADRAAAEELLAALGGRLNGAEIRDYGSLTQSTEAGRLDLWVGN